jgi:RNA polymerase sigma factor (sigma-70 family)
MREHENSLATRTSLLRQVKNEVDETKWEQGWEEFYSIYQPLVVGVGRQAGLNSEEAEDVLQDVMTELRLKIHDFQPDRERGPFKAWLLNRVRWRIADQLRKRLPLVEGDTDVALETSGLKADAASKPCSDEEWDQAWRQRLLEEAMERVKDYADEKQFQIFRICTTQKIRAQRVAESFGVSLMQVYLAKHRVGKLIKKEVERLERAMSVGREPV